MGEAVELQVGARVVRLSNPGKVYYPGPGYTKLDVAQYYQAVAEAVLRGLRDRPTTLQRFPDGVEGEFFYQKRAPKNTPDWLPTARIAFPSGRFADEICPGEPAAVLWAANLGCLTFHPGRCAATTPTGPTSCGWTSTRSRAPTSPTRCAPPTSCVRCSPGTG